MAWQKCQAINVFILISQACLQQAFYILSNLNATDIKSPQSKSCE